MTLVGKYSSKDLKVFYNYVETAFSAQLYKVTPANFQPMSEMFNLFVREGFFTPTKTNKFYFTYLLALKNEIMKTSKDTTKKQITADNLIGITWSMMAMETPGHLSTPLLPKLFEELYSFERPNKPLTKHELIQLHQINSYIEDAISAGAIPENFNSVIPRKVQALAADAYIEWDQPLYMDVQKDIAQKLLKLRVTFKENVPAAYDDVDDVEVGEKVTFRLSGENSGRVLLLKGDRNSNADTSELTGPYGVSLRRLVEQSK